MSAAPNRRVLFKRHGRREGGGEGERARGRWTRGQKREARIRTALCRMDQRRERRARNKNRWDGPDAKRWWRQAAGGGID
eukprot:4508957-Pyramimonas_sp.AAC.1